MDVQMLAIDTIDGDPSQPRRTFTGLDELAVSITDHGLLEPIMVRPVGDRYVIVHGERRWRAAKIAGLTTIPAMVREMDEQTAYRLAVVENVQRENLTALDEDYAYQRLIDQGMTQAEIGRLVGKGRSRVAQILALLRRPAPLQAAVGVAGLGEAHVRAVMVLSDIYGPNLIRSLNEPPIDDAERDQARRLWDLPDEAVAIWLYAVARPEERSPFIGPSPAVRPIAAALMECYLSNVPLPQWVVAGSYWLALAASIDLSVSKLAVGIDNWRKRYASALLHHRIHPSPPAPGAHKDRSRLWWGYYGDLKHSGSLHRPHDADDEGAMTLAQTTAESGEWLWPSIYQYAIVKRAAGDDLYAHDREILAEVDTDAA